MPKFSANIIYLFNEVDLIDRISAAATVGFRAVECQRPYEIPPVVFRDLLNGFSKGLVALPVGSFLCLRKILRDSRQGGKKDTAEDGEECCAAGRRGPARLSISDQSRLKRCSFLAKAL